MTVGIQRVEPALIVHIPFATLAGDIVRSRCSQLSGKVHIAHLEHQRRSLCMEPTATWCR